MRRCGLTDRLSRLAGKEPGRQFRLGFALAKVKDDRSFIPPSRLVRWANNGIEPEDIDDAALGRYRKELKFRLMKQAEKIHQTTCYLSLIQQFRDQVRFGIPSGNAILVELRSSSRSRWPRHISPDP